MGKENVKADIFLGGSSTRINSTDSKGRIDIVKLDDYIKNNKVTLIKADVEGMEMDVIDGAKNIISNQKPKLAICVYHLPWDIYKIPLKIKELNLDYKFKLRRHSNDYRELVLYCY